MGVLREYLRNEADHIRAEVAKRNEWSQEWRVALDRLYDRLEGWLKDADSDLGLLTIKRRDRLADVNEPRLGTYPANGMWVILGGGESGGTRSAKVAPKARFVAATIKPPGEEPRRAEGMVEITSGSTPEYYLFRLAGPTVDEDRWFIRNVDQWNADPEYGKVEPLDRERFEAAMLRVLQ
jgi:hypothetical protein